MKKNEAKDAIGMCVACSEWTSVLEPCCNAPVHFEGSTIDFEDIEDLDYCEHCESPLLDDEEVAFNRKGIAYAHLGCAQENYSGTGCSATDKY